MGNDLRSRTILGLFWSLVDSFANQGIQFIIGVVLARLLSPKDFGIIGVLSIFMAISQLFINGGFSNALIRKKYCSEEDYSTVFIFNAIVSVFIYLLLFVSSNFISVYFNEPELLSLIKVLGFGLIINSLSLIQRVKIAKKVDYKLQSKISLSAGSISGVTAIICAINGMGVWSLVVMSLSRYTITTIMLWFSIQWFPQKYFNKKSFFDLFSFGSLILLSSLINTFTQKIYYIIIGKYFSTVELGFYSRAEQFQQLPTYNLNSIVSRVSMPMLVLVQGDTDRLRVQFKKLLRGTMFISTIVLFGLATTSRPLIELLLGKEWLPVVPYLKLLAFAGVLYPMHLYNLQLLKIKKRSDYYLKLELIKVLLTIPVLVIGIRLGIEAMILGMMAASVIALVLNTYYTNIFLDYSFKAQVIDVLPIVMLSAVINLLALSMEIIFTGTDGLLLFMQFSVILILSILCGMKYFSDEYELIKNIANKKLRL